MRKCVAMANTTFGNRSSMDSEDGDYMNSILLRVGLISAYSVIFVFGVAGNTLVVYVVARNAMMQTVTNVFIANLAASDIMMCLLAVPFTPISGLIHAWPFGDLLCHLVPMTLGVSVYVSTLTSTAIAIDRYCVIVHPFLRRLRIRACLLLIAIIWSIAVSISLPLALYHDLVWIDDGAGFYSCEENWPDATSRKLFTVVSIALQYVAPCVVITYCYAHVSVALRRRAAREMSRTGSTRRDTTANGQHADLRNRMKLRRKRRTNRMLIAMVVIFAVCWLPLNVVFLSLEYDEAVGASPYFLLVFFGAHVVAMSSTVYNPFLYAWMNDNFRKEFRRVFPCLRMPPNCRGGGSALPLDTTLPVAVTKVAVKQRPQSPSRYSTAVGRTDQQGGSGDRLRGGVGGQGPRTRMDVDELQVRFIDYCDNNEVDGDCLENVAMDDNGANGQR